MGKGGGAGTQQDYYGSIAGVICAGPVDAIVAIIVDSKTVWPKSTFWANGEFLQSSPPQPAPMVRVFGGRAWECIKSHICDPTNQPPNPEFWKLFVVLRADVSPNGEPFKMAVKNYGEAWLYWGTANQELSTSPPNPPNKTQPPENVFAQLHPPYRRQCWIFFKNFLLGRERITAPNVEVVVRRNPNQTLIAGTALDPDGQANPVAFEAELLTNPVFGAGLPNSRLDSNSWTQEAAYCATAPSQLYLTPRVDESVTLRKILPDSLQYRDGWIRYNKAGQLELGHFTHNQGPPPVTPETTVNFHVASEPIQFATATMDSAATEVLIKFISARYSFKESSIRVFSGATREIMNQSRVNTIERPWITRAEQAQQIGATEANLAGEPILAGSFEVRAERAAAIIPGALFLLTHDALSLSIYCRCTSRIIPSPDSGIVKIEFARERGLSEVPFQPTIAMDQGPTPPPVESLTLARIFQPPPGMVQQSGYFVAILVARLDPITTGFTAWFRKEESEAFTLLSETQQRHFAIEGTLAANYPADLPPAGTSPADDDSWTLAVTAHESSVDADLEKIAATQTADAITDDTLLLGVFAGAALELMTVKEVRKAENGNLEFRVRRARFGTIQAAWTAGAEVFIFYRSDLVFYTHQKFLEYAKTGETATFRLEGRSPFGVADVGDPAQCPDMHYSFVDAFTPDVTWVSIQWRPNTSAAFAEVTDFSQAFDPAGQWKVTARFTDPDGDLADGRIFGRIGALENSFWAQTFAGTQRQIETVFSLQAGDWQIFGRVRDATNRSRERGMTAAAGGPVVTLHIQSTTPATQVANPVVTPHGGSVITGTQVTITCSTPGAQIFVASVPLFQPPPAKPFSFAISSGQTYVVNLNNTLYCYGHAAGLADSVMVQEDYEGPR